MSPGDTRQKKLRQTDISSYFNGSVKILPIAETPLQCKKRMYKRRGWSSLSSRTSPSNIECSLLDESRRSDLCIDFAKYNIKKRKLPIPILPDDQDEENQGPSADKSKTPIIVARQVQISLNRPSSLVSSKITTLSEKLSLAQQSSSMNSVETPTTSRNARIKILENLCVSPQKVAKFDATPTIINESPVKTEGRKLNFDNVKVLRQFCLNILKSNHLKLLIAKEDEEMLMAFFNMDKYYQYTCVKLFVWKRTWYNIFHYVRKIGLTLGDHVVKDMYNELKTNKFVETDYMIEDSFTLLNLLSLKDVRAIQQSFKLGRNKSTKAEIISNLLSNCKRQATLTQLKNMEDVLRDQIRNKMGFCVTLSQHLDRCLYTIFLLNTFTNSSLVEPQEYFANINYFGTVFPSYKVEDFNVFYTQDEFSKYLNAVQLFRELERASEKKNVLGTFEICKMALRNLKELNMQSGDSFDSSREKHLERFTPNAVYIRILTKGGIAITTRHYEQVKIWFEYLLSQGYCRHVRARWYCHLSLIYSTYIKDYEKAAHLVISSLEQEGENFSEVQLHELAYRGNVLNKKTYNLSAWLHDKMTDLSPAPCERNWPQTKIESRSITSDKSGKKRTYIKRSENGDFHYLTVEQIALDYYRSVGYPSGKHCEGSLVTVLFCLLFWDILYDTYIKGTFISKVQNVPLDFYTKYFYTNRESLIKKRLKSIAQDWDEAELKLKLLNNFEQHSHESSVCQIETIVPEPSYLLDIVKCVGRGVLAKILERLVANFSAFHSGFPDLLVWNCERKQAKFVEVKGEKDKLSIKQKLWLNYLMDVGADVEVCHVLSKSTKKKLTKRADQT